MSSANENDRSWTWLMCTELGWFQSGSVTGMRPDSINLSFFDRVCETMFNRSHVDPKDQNLIYGGTDTAARNVYFMSGEADPWSTLAVTSNDSATERAAGIESHGYHSHDLLRPVSLLNDILARLANWIQFNSPEMDICHAKGQRILSHCKCNKGWAGDACEDHTHPQEQFRIVSIVAVVLTTVLLLVLGSAIWLCGKNDMIDTAAKPEVRITSSDIVPTMVNESTFSPFT
jgi:hypothetical protein